MGCSPVGFRDLCSQQSTHEWTPPDPFPVMLQMVTFSTFPTTTPFAPSPLNVLPPDLSSVPPQSRLIHSIPFIQRLLTQSQTHPAFKSLNNTPFFHQSKLYLHIILSSPPINVLYMGDPFLLILKIRKKDVFLRSLRIICPSYRKVRIRKIKCSNTKRNGKRLLTSSVLVNSQLYPHWSVQFIRHRNDSFLPQSIKMAWRHNLNCQWLINLHYFPQHHIHTLLIITVHLNTCSGTSTNLWASQPFTGIFLQ